MKADKRPYRYKIKSILLIVLCITFFYTDNIKINSDLNNSYNSALFAKTKYFTLNFKDADITEFLNVMSQLIGKNIIIDDKVRGKITISSVKKFPVSQAYPILKPIRNAPSIAHQSVSSPVPSP